MYRGGSFQGDSGLSQCSLLREIFLRSTMFLLGYIGMVGATVEVSIYEIIVFVEPPKRACTWEVSMK